MRLAIIRHASAEGMSMTQNDIDRSLTMHGKKEAHNLSQKLKNKGFVFDLIISSTAKRTRQTTQAMIDQEIVNETEFEQSFYLSGLIEVGNKISTLKKSPKFVALIGHNPGWSDMIYKLTRRIVTLVPSECYILQHPSDTFSEQSNWKVEQIISP